MSTDPKISPADVEILRRLAERKMQIAADPVNIERKKAWLKHDAGPGGRAMILAEQAGVGDEVSLFSQKSLKCSGELARGVEWGLAFEIMQFEELKDDHVVEPWHNVNWKVTAGNYGVESVKHLGDNDGKLGARRWDPPIADLDRDFHKLHPRTFSVDRKATLEERDRLATIFKDIMPVRIRGNFWWTMGMTITAVDLIGLENLMLYMFDNPAGLHRLMAFLRDDHLAYAAWLEKEGLLTLNNENDYIGSGSMGYSAALPRHGLKPGAPARQEDLWVLLESQETVGVGPEQFEEFIFPYQLEISKRFGRCYYGCCEPLHSRWHVVKKLNNVARASISPWADEEFMARELGTGVVYSRKPSPTMISTAKFDENAIRADLRKTLRAAKGCRLELVMKDVHTLNNEPRRLPRWVELARETAEEEGAA